MKPQLPLRGSCQCQAVRYEIRQEPLTVYVCHCHDCQRQSGSAFSVSMIVARDAVAITRGTPKEWLRRGGSGQMISCWFCQTCGVRLYHEPHANTAITIVKSTTLDDGAALNPVGHIWTRSAQSWFPIPDDSIQYEMQPTDRSALIEAWKAKRDQ